MFGRNSKQRKTKLATQNNSLLIIIQQIFAMENCVQRSSQRSSGRVDFNGNDFRILTDIIIRLRLYASAHIHTRHHINS